MKIKSIDWPPYSPDLNPIENVWGLMARKIKPKDIMTKSDLIEAVKSALNEIDKEVIENCRTQCLEESMIVSPSQR